MADGITPVLCGTVPHVAVEDDDGPGLPEQGYKIITLFSSFQIEISDKK